MEVAELIAELRDLQAAMATAGDQEVRDGRQVFDKDLHTSSTEAIEGAFLVEHQVEGGEMSLFLLERPSAEGLYLLLEAGAADGPHLGPVGEVDHLGSLLPRDAPPCFSHRGDGEGAAAIDELQDFLLDGFHIRLAIRVRYSPRHRA